MAETISLVKGDSLANLAVSLVRDDTGAAFVPESSSVLNIRVRKKGTTTVLTGFPLAHDAATSSFATGQIVFKLGTFLSTAEEGYYEGEIEIIFNPGASQTTQTVFEVLNFRVRAEFG